MTESTTTETQTSSRLRFSVAMLAGAAIAAVDNFAFHGEISPIVIVAQLLLCSGIIGLAWGVRGFSVSAILWAWLPAAHLIKHVFNLPDTIIPIRTLRSLSWRLSFFYHGNWFWIRPALAPRPSPRAENYELRIRGSRLDEKAV